MRTVVYFVRHGESESNLIHQFAGSLDMPLTARGREQAVRTAEFLRDVPFTAVYASTLARAYATGETVAKAHGLHLVGERALQEIYAGLWEGKNYSALEQEFPESYGVWRTQIGLAQCPEGESVAGLQKRVRQCVEEIVARHPGETICIATHATPIRVMECVWTNTPLAQMHTIPWASNASVTIAEYDEAGVGRLLERDLHAHLGELRTVLAKNV